MDEGRPIESALVELELRLLTEAIYRRYGHDYRDYARDTLRRRVVRAVLSEGVQTISGLQEKVLHEPRAMERLRQQLAVQETSLFRDPSFFVALREKVLPRLRSVPIIRVWHAGCSTGEEVYSLAIVLHREGLAERVRIYATDVDESRLERARAGLVPGEALEDSAANYARVGLAGSLGDYCQPSPNGDGAQLSPDVRRQVLFSVHSLATDASFNEFSLILCRDVLPHLDEALRRRVYELLHASLRRFGVLALGRGDTLRGSPHADAYQELDAAEHLYRRGA
jgi:chemotaxis protein methyltransferase CheR